MTSTEATAPRPRSTPGVAVVLAWLVVALPAAWGVYQTCVKSTALFAGPAAAAAAPPSSRPSMP